MNGQGCFSLTMFKKHIQTVFTNLFQLQYNYVESKLLLVVMVYLLIVPVIKTVLNCYDTEHLLLIKTLRNL